MKKGHRQRRELALVAALVCLVALVAAISAYSVHVACFEPPIPYSRPAPGSPRAGYCDALQTARPWISLIVLPCLVMLAGGLLSRRRRRVAMALAVLICVVVAANAVVANNLDYWAFEI